MRLWKKKKCSNNEEAQKFRIHTWLAVICARWKSLIIKMWPERARLRAGAALTLSPR